MAARACVAIALLIGTAVTPTATARSQRTPQRADVYDLVLLGGRVIDPESQLDAIRAAE